MLPKSVCILFSGKAGVGKSFSAKLMAQQLLAQGYTPIIMPLAFSVKHIAKIGFDWDGNKDPKGRKLLQEIGGIGREYNKDIWVKKVIDEYVPKQINYPLDFLLIDDWRFPNEREYIAENGLYSVYTIRICSPNRESLWGTPQYNDVSETALDKEIFDYIIRNEGSVDELKLILKDIAEEIINKEDTYGGR